MSPNERKAFEAYFKVPELAKAFAIAHLDGDRKNEILGITVKLYRDPIEAANWYRAIRAELVRCRPHLPKNEYSHICDLTGKLFNNMTAR